MTYALKLMSTPCRRSSLRILLVALVALIAPLHTSFAASQEPFRLGTDYDADTLVGKWYRRIYDEAFRRLQIPLTIVVLPLARLGVAANSGEVDGQAARVLSYADANPAQVRVADPFVETRLQLFASESTTKAERPKRVEDLASGKWLVQYRRGVAICENLLKPLVPTANLSDITTSEQALKKLISGRADLYCEFDLVIQVELVSPHFKGVTGIRPLFELRPPLQFYPYVHKNHAELAPKLASVLNQMRTEGLIDRYFRDSLREMETAR